MIFYHSVACLTGTSDVQVHGYTFVDDSCLSVIRSAIFEHS